MNKREKILLLLALMFVLYSLIYFFVLPKKEDSQQIMNLTKNASETTEKFALDSMTELSRIEAQGNKLHWQILMSKIESSWENDPFVLPMEPETSADVSSSPSSFDRFLYSGYLNVGKISFAVINGKEYKIGETIDEYEYTIIKITPRKVILQKDTDQAVIFLKEE